jgi:hypothetical protein
VDYYNNIFCISKPELTDGDPKSSDPTLMPIMSVAAYKKYVLRYPHVKVREGKGKNNHALLNYDLLRTDIKQRVLIKYGDVKGANRVNKLARLITPDYQAAKYYREYMIDEDNSISPERQKEYADNASVLNAIGRLLSEMRGNRKKLGNSTARVWDEINEMVIALDPTKHQHTLPAATARLKEKFEKYAEGGYYELIHKGRGNSNSRKRTPEIDNMIISLYCQGNLPFGEWCVEDYLRFVAGEVEIVNYETGELIDRSNFYDRKRGTYTQISRSTMWNILNEPSTANLVDRLRNNRIDHVTQNTPYNHRHSPRYSLSKISMDDRTLSRKTTDGRWLNVYMAVDVMSGAWLSAVHSTDAPSVSMVWDCFREMYRTLDTNGLMWPGEVEVENHLMSGIRKELESMFTYVTFCAPGISRSKRAEHNIKSKKYGDEKRNQVGIGRHNQKGPYKTKSENKDEDYKQPRLPVATLIQDDLDSIRRHNAELHPDQKRLRGKTRWQVLIENQHPDLGRPVKSLLMRYIGLRTETSIRNNDFVRVQYQDYAIDNLMNLNRLKPNNKEVVACYLPPPAPSKGGEYTIPEVWLYQDETFIGRASLIEKYNEAKMERTEEDERIRTEQAKRQAHFFKVEKDLIAEKVTRKLGVVSTGFGSAQPSKYFEDMKVEIIPEPEERKVDLDKLVEQYSGGWYEIGIENA